MAIDNPYLTLLPLAGSIVAALVAWVQAVKVTRLNADTQLKIEEMRADQAKQRQAFDMTLEQMRADNEKHRLALDVASREAQPVEEALDRAWGHLQKVKDAITAATGSTPVDKDLVMSQVRAANNALAGEYTIRGAQLSERARDAWHAVRMVSNVATGLLIQRLGAPSDPADVARIDNALADHRAALTDYQNVLRDERHELRTRAMYRLLTRL